VSKTSDQAVGARCAWCGRADRTLTEDHVFPRVLGGTKELWIPSCTECQTSISRAELEVGRSSFYSLFRLTQGPKGRDKRKPGSGLLEARYMLVKHPLGGYGEAVLRVGDETPQALPSIEIDTANHRGIRRRGMKPQEVDDLVQVLAQVQQRAPSVEGFLAQLPVRLDKIPHIDEDVDFWPRVVLDVRHKPFIRARNEQEALSFAELLYIFVKNYRFGEYAAWTEAEVKGGTPHQLLLSYRRTSMHRMVAKVLVALAQIRNPELAENRVFQSVSRFILGVIESAGGVEIKDVCWPDTISSWPEHHVVYFGRCDGRVVGAKSFYGDCHLVDFGPADQFPELMGDVAARCRRDGTRAEIMPEDFGVHVRDTLLNYAQGRNQLSAQRINNTN
jgi:hypothetical protein